MDHEILPLLSSRRTDNDTSHGRYCGMCCQSRHFMLVCLQHKALLLILSWTVIFGEFYALIQVLSGGLIENYVPTSDRKKNFANAVASPMTILYAILAMIAMLYPISGFIADVCCGRFKTVMAGLTFTLVFIITITAALIGWVSIKHAHQLIALDSFKEVAPFYIISFATVPFIIFGLGAFQANIIQFGLDQLLDAPSIHLTVFIHLAVWSDTLGTTLTTVAGAVVSCARLSIKVRVAFCVVPISILICFPFLLILACWKRHWFYSESGQQNPYKNVLKVLNFVRKNNRPLQRSAFTYDGSERPSRMDYAKERYGGPFTTERVEDVKTCLRILGLLFSLGPVFVMEVPTSFVGFKTFGLHTGYKEDFLGRCIVWAFLESTALSHSIAVFFLPLYLCTCVINRRISMFTRLFAGLLIYILGTLSMLAIDLAGHLHHVNDLGTGSQCMFTYTRANSADALTYPILEMHWAVLIIPNVLLGIGPPILMCTAFELISAQSPHSMKGLLVGVFFAIKGFFQLISSTALVPISSDRLWAKVHSDKHLSVINCGFIYFLFTLVVALVGLVLLSVVVKRYKYRERDDRPYDHSIVEEIFDRRNRMRSPTPDYNGISDS